MNRTVCWLVLALVLSAPKFVCGEEAVRNESFTLKIVRHQTRDLEGTYSLGDVEGMLSLWAENGQFIMYGGFTVRGKGQLRRLLETDALLNGRLTLSNVKDDGRTVTCRVKEQNDWLKAAGIDAIYYEYNEFTTDKGLLVRVRAKHTDQTWRRLEGLDRSFGHWLSENRKAEKQQLDAAEAQGRWKEAAKKEMQLLPVWREESLACVQKAVTKAVAALERAPNDRKLRLQLDDAYTRLGETQIARGDFDQADRSFGKLVELWKAVPESKRSAEDCGRLGQAYYLAGDYKIARQSLEKCIALRKETAPSLVEGPQWWFLTVALARLGDTAKAKRTYDKLVQNAAADSAPNGPYAHLRSEAEFLLDIAIEPPPPTPTKPESK